MQLEEPTNLTRGEIKAEAMRLAASIQDLQSRAAKANPLHAIPIIKQASSQQAIFNRLLADLL